jgi:hypothetical protein
MRPSLRHRCMAVWFALTALPACEYRDQASVLVIEQSCYVLIGSHTVVIRAQTQNASHDGVDGVAVRWSVAPALLTLDPRVTSTEVIRTGAIASHGMVATTVSATEKPASETTTVTIMASAAVYNELLVATAEVRIGADESAVMCPTASGLDAGVEAAPDAATDAAVDAPAGN